MNPHILPSHSSSSEEGQQSLESSNCNSPPKFPFEQVIERRLEAQHEVPSARALGCDGGHFIDTEDISMKHFFDVETHAKHLLWPPTLWCKISWETYYQFSPLKTEMFHESFLRVWTCSFERTWKEKEKRTSTNRMLKHSEPLKRSLFEPDSIAFNT